ncbi:MAG: hypothetical protein COA97_06180 [Flavobacteriales bacterium]|nr:MAG: hypothetical protein COA97_06180 [Flavobacteriales bacterium]
MACPYEGEVEINTYEESVKIDKKLIDEWVSFNEEGGREELSISKLARSVFQVYHKQYGKGNKLESRESYRAYASEVGNYDIFNIESKDGKYLFSKYGWTGKNEFYIQFIDADYMEKKFKVDTVTTENLRAFITENVNKEAMYGDKLEFYRKGSPEYDKVRMFMRKSGF